MRITGPTFEHPLILQIETKRTLEEVHSIRFLLAHGLCGATEAGLDDWSSLIMPFTFY
jgi:hypothetical protein